MGDLRLVMGCMLLALSGCQQAPETTSTPAGPEMPTDVTSVGPDTEVARQPGAAPGSLASVGRSPEGDAAAFTGTLLIEGGCAFLVTDTERVVLVAAGPDLAMAAGDAAVMASGTRIPGGSAVLATGSSVATANLAGRWIDAPEERCTAARSWLTVSLAPR